MLGESKMASVRFIDSGKVVEFDTPEALAVALKYQSDGRVAGEVVGEHGVVMEINRNANEQYRRQGAFKFGGDCDTCPFHPICDVMSDYTCVLPDERHSQEIDQLTYRFYRDFDAITFDLINQAKAKGTLSLARYNNGIEINGNRFEAEMSEVEARIEALWPDHPVIQNGYDPDDEVPEENEREQDVPQGLAQLLAVLQAMSRQGSADDAGAEGLIL